MRGTVSLSDRDPSAPSTVVGAAKVAGGGLALWAGVQLLATYLERRTVLSATLQAALAEWGAGHLGIAWSSPLGPVPTAKDYLRRIARGAAYGGATALAVIAAAVATRAATATFADSPSVGMLAVGLLTSMLAAVRDELILRGVVLRATRGLASRWVSLLACGMAAAAARLGVDGMVGMALAAEALRGVALAALWIQDAGVWMAWAANAAWMWSLGSAAHGGLLDVRFATDADGAAGTIVVLSIVALLAADPRRLSRSGLR
jgi:hypothetical protein